MFGMRVQILQQSRISHARRAAASHHNLTWVENGDIASASAERNACLVFPSIVLCNQQCGGLKQAKLLLSYVNSSQMYRRTNCVVSFVRCSD